MVAILTQVFLHLAVVKASHVLGVVRKGVGLRTPSCISKATKDVHPHLEGSVQFWSLHFQEIIKGLGKVWRRAMALGSEVFLFPSLCPELGAPFLESP